MVGKSFRKSIYSFSEAAHLLSLPKKYNHNRSSSRISLRMEGES